MTYLILVISLFLATALITGTVRSYALRSELLDVPNERSSHSEPTPRGGGLAIVGLVVAGWIVGAVMDLVATNYIVPLIIGGLIVAAVGYLDDLGHVSVVIRILVHFSAALFVVTSVGGIEFLSFPGRVLDLGLAGAAVAVLYIVWLLNLTNFMDGIDGIAAVEVITVTLSASILLTISGDDTLAFACAGLGASSAGFLIWNWPPARIFLGDVGSGFLGFCLGAFAVISHTLGSMDIYVWTILLGSFVVDATVTLVRRLMNGQKIYEAHRSHAYQHAAIRFQSHASVGIAIGAINLLWLLPIASLVATGRIAGLYGTLIAYLPLVMLVLRFGAGRSASRP